MSKQVKQYIGTLQNRIANQRAEIERLHREIEKLTIQCNAWHLTAERVGEELQVAKANAETLDICLKDFRSRNKELQKANEGLAKQCEDFESELLDCVHVKRDTVQKMQEMFNQKVSNTFVHYGWYLKEVIVPQIAKEVLKGESNENQT